MKALGISLRTYASWKRDGVPDTRWGLVAAACGVDTRDLAVDRAKRLEPAPDASQREPGDGVPRHPALGVA